MAGSGTIYHTARCGSTFLAALLSQAAPTFAEPPWAETAWRDGYPLPESRSGAIVKPPSVAVLHHPLPGPKVFLYRPLAQHLMKYRSIDRNWLKGRLRRMEEHLEEELKEQGTTRMFAAFWAKQVEAALAMEALFIRSNDLFGEPEAVAREVLDHFGIEGEPDLRFVGVDVKTAGFIGQADPIRFPSRGGLPLVASGHGVTTTATAMSDPLIASAVEWVSKLYPKTLIFTR